MTRKKISTGGGFYTSSDTYAYANSLIEKNMEFAASLFRTAVQQNNTEHFNNSKRKNKVTSDK